MGKLTATHTYVTMEVSSATYEEVARLLKEADYHHCFNDDGEIDMHGLALVKKKYVDPRPKKPWSDWPDECHESHETRVSDASSFDEICTLCGRTDRSGAGWGWLRMPCPAKKK